MNQTHSVNLSPNHKLINFNVPNYLINNFDNLVKFKACSHILHKKCANRFLLHYMRKCPICRKYIYVNPRHINI